MTEEQSEQLVTLLTSIDNSKKVSAGVWSAVIFQLRNYARVKKFCTFIEGGDEKTIHEKDIDIYAKVFLENAADCAVYAFSREHETNE